MTQTASRPYAAEKIRRATEELVKYRRFLAAELAYPADLQNAETVSSYRNAVIRLEKMVAA